MQIGQTGSAAALAGWGVGVKHHAASNGAAGLGIANDQAVTRNGVDGVVQHQLCGHFRAWFNRAILQQGHVCGAALGADVHMHCGPLLHGLGFCQQVQANVYAVTGLQYACVGDPVAANDVLFGNARQIQCAALARQAHLCSLILGVDAAHAHGLTASRVLQHIAHSDLAAEHRARDHRALAGQGEDAVYCQTEQPVLRPGRHHQRLYFQVLAQRLHTAVAGLAGCGFKNGAFVQAGDGQDGCNFQLHLFDALGQHAVHLGQGDRAVFYAQQLQNLKVLQRLRHYPVVGRHHQQGVVNAHSARCHGVYKSFMAGYVNDAQHISVGQGGIGVAQLNRNAPRFFFFETVSFHAREGAYQCGFAVVNVSSGTDDHASTF